MQIPRHPINNYQLASSEVVERTVSGTLRSWRRAKLSRFSATQERKADRSMWKRGKITRRKSNAEAFKVYYLR